MVYWDFGQYIVDMFLCYLVKDWCVCGGGCDGIDQNVGFGQFFVQ